MVAFGGAGPMFAVDLARVFGMSRIAIPAVAGVGSAAGLLHADLSVEQVRTRVLAATEADFPTVTAIFEQLSAAALEGIGQDAADVEWRYSIDMRYRGQAHQLPVPLSRDDLAAGPDPVLTAFRAVYESAYGVAQNLPAEFVTYRVRAICPFAARDDMAPQLASDAPPPLPAASRPATFAAGDDFPAVAVFRRVDLRTGHRLSGPAFIEGPESTTLLPPGVLLTVDSFGTLHLWPDGRDA